MIIRHCPNCKAILLKIKQSDCNLEVEMICQKCGKRYIIKLVCEAEEIKN